MNNVDDFEKILERRIFAWLGYVVALCISSMAAISHGAVLHSYEDDGATLVMTVDGRLVFAPGATFSIDDETAIERKPRGIVVATAAGGVQGVPSTSLRSGRWALSRVGNEVRLGPSAGLAVMIR